MAKTVVLIVKLTGPTSEIAYEFESQGEAGDWLKAAMLSGRWEREKWLTPRIMPLEEAPEP